MPKLTLNNITSGYASIAALNSNFDLIEAALENTLSRDGTTPNSMSGDLDMNSQNLINVNRINGTLFTDISDLNAAIAQAQAAQAGAELAKANAETAEVNAETAEANAETAEANAETAEANAAASAAQAAVYASMGLGGATAFDFGYITDVLIIFPTDYGTIV